MADAKHDPGELEALADTAREILGRWGASRSQCDALLGGGRRTRRRARREGAGPSDEERVERMQHIFAIERALSQTFPQSPLLAEVWVTTPHRMLDGDTPLQVMCAGGTAGLSHIRQMLCGEADWGGI